MKCYTETKCIEIASNNNIWTNIPRLKICLNEGSILSGIYSELHPGWDCNIEIFNRITLILILNSIVMQSHFDFNKKVYSYHYHIHITSTINVFILHLI